MRKSIIESFLTIVSSEVILLQEDYISPIGTGSSSSKADKVGTRRIIQFDSSPDSEGNLFDAGKGEPGADEQDNDVKASHSSMFETPSKPKPKQQAQSIFTCEFCEQIEFYQQGAGYGQTYAGAVCQSQKCKNFGTTVG